MAPSSSPQANTSRRYGTSCTVCRRRKVRCNGAKPTCSPCMRLGERCVYPSESASTSRLANALDRSQSRIQELEQTVRSLAGGDAQVRTATSESPRVRTGGDIEGQLPSEQLSIDEHGKPEHYGATSRFHVNRSSEASQTVSLRPVEETTAAANSFPVDAAYHKKWLRSNARFQDQWERAAHAKLALDPDITADEASTLLGIYWTWQAPLHHCVYRRCFTRDMALGGPYFSLFLLNVIYAHACRHAKRDDARFRRFEQGEYFLRKAKQLLIEEFGQKPRITTIQGLLILGGRQCAIGKSSEGWLYTGMAIRMIQDLGLHLSPAQEALRTALEPDDLEVRKRLYLSAFAWDKTISLTLGRSPSLTEMPYLAHCLLDDSDSEELWAPYYLGDSEQVYPPIRGLYTLTFSYFVEQAKVGGKVLQDFRGQRLTNAKIINKIYACVYDARHSERLSFEKLSSLEAELRAFHETLPSSIRVDDIASLTLCPPPHIFTLNILYDTALILLYRPLFFRSYSSVQINEPRTEMQQRACAVCTEQSARVNAFFRAYGQTYYFRNQSYLTSYCVYTAATIEVVQVRNPDPRVSSAAVERLGTTLSMLEAEATQTPGIRRSVDIIRAQLGNLGVVDTASSAAADGFVDATLQAATDALELRRGHVHEHEAIVTHVNQDIAPSDWTSWLDSYITDAGAGFDPSFDVGGQEYSFNIGQPPQG